MSQIEQAMGRVTQCWAPSWMWRSNRDRLPPVFTALTVTNPSIDGR